MKRKRIQFISYLGGSFSALMLLQTPTAAHAINVFLDYTDFEARLDELTASAGVNPFSSGEVNTLQSGILSGLNQIYADFTVDFTEQMPTIGSFETLSFGLTTPRGLGLADQIDFRNQTPDDLGRTYTANFSFILDEFSGSANRQAQIDQLTAALTGTAAHELGHNLGLQHHDAYGDSQITPANYANTRGVQNTFMMATGSTGLNEQGREQIRPLSTLSKAKLIYAEGLTQNGPPASLNETAASQSATGQKLTLTDLPISEQVQAANLIGEISGSGEVDLFSFEGIANSLFTANILSNSLVPEQIANPIDSIVSLLDQEMNVLARNDDILYGATQFNQGAFHSLDSILLNFVLPTTGRYFLEVTTFRNTDSGDYQLFVAQELNPQLSNVFTQELDPELSIASSAVSDTFSSLGSKLGDSQSSGNPQSIPEPSTLLGFLIAGLFGSRLLRRQTYPETAVVHE